MIVPPGMPAPANLFKTKQNPKNRYVVKLGIGKEKLVKMITARMGMQIVSPTI